MVNYKILPDMSDHTYGVVETNTMNVIKNNMDHLHAKMMCRHLNFGGGFDGWTPAFFLQKIEKNDQQFKELV